MNAMSVINLFRAQLSKASLYCVVGLGFSIPISPALTNLFLVLLLATFLLSGSFIGQWSRFRDSRPALLSCAVFVMFMLAAIYSPASLKEIGSYLNSNKKILLVPLLIIVLPNDQWRLRALIAVFSALVLTLILSYLAFVPGIPEHWYKLGFARGDVFANRTTQGMWFLLAGFACLGWAYYSHDSRRNKIGWTLLGGLFLINVLYFVSGRTALVMFIPLTFVSLMLISPRRALMGGLIILVLAGIIYFTSDYAQLRLMEIVQEVSAYRQKSEVTSSGLRLFYYQQGWALAVQALIFGHGTASIPILFDQHIMQLGYPVELWRTPQSLHNQFLNWLFEFGVLGLGLISWLIWCYWTAARGLHAIQRYLMGMLLTSYLFNSLLNSPFESFYDAYFLYFLIAVLVVKIDFKKSIA